MDNKNIIDFNSLKLSNVYRLQSSKNISSKKYVNSSFKCGDKQIITEPYPHQRLIEYYMNNFQFINNKGLLVYHGLGSGKTCASIIAAAKNKFYKHIIILLPAFLKPNYITEIKEKCLKNLEGKTEQYLEENDINVFSYNSTTIPVKICETYIKEKRNFKEDLRNPVSYELVMNLLLKALEDLNKNIFIVIDEAHHIFQTITNYKLKVKTSETFKFSMGLFFYDLLMNCNCKILFLTGTPLTNYAYESAVIGNLCRGYLYKESRTGTIFPENPEAFYQTYIDQQTNLLSSIRRDEFTRKFFGLISYFPNIENIEVFPELNVENMTKENRENYNRMRKQLALPSGQQLNLETLDQYSKYRLEVEVHELELYQTSLEGINFPSTQLNIYKENQEKEEEELKKSKKSKGSKSLSFMQSENEISSFRSNTRIASNFVFPEHYFYMILLHIYLFGLKQNTSIKNLLIETEISGNKVTISANFTIVWNSLHQHIMDKKQILELSDEESIEKKVIEILKQLEDIQDLEQLIRVQRIFDQFDNQRNYIIPSNFRYLFCINPEDKKNYKKLHNDILRVIYYFIELQNKYPKLKSELSEDTIQYYPIDKIRNFEILMEYFQNDLLLNTFSVKYLEIKNLLNDIKKYKEQQKARKKLFYSFYKNQAGTRSLRYLLLSMGFQEHNPVTTIEPKEVKKEKLNTSIFDTLENLDKEETEDEVEQSNAMINSQLKNVSDMAIMNLKPLAGNFSGRKFVVFEGENDRRRKVIEDFNKDPTIDIIIISTAGSEGISLKNVRDVFILEPYWNLNRIIQVIGRARRICSHKNLPEEERKVKVYKFIATIANESKSTDRAINSLSENKKKLNDDILSVFETIAIDCQLLSGDKKKICYTDTIDFGEKNIKNIIEIENSKNYYLYKYYIDKKSKRYEFLDKEVLKSFIDGFNTLITKKTKSSLEFELRQKILIPIWNLYVEKSQMFDDAESSKSIKKPDSVDKMYSFIVYGQNELFYNIPSENKFNLFSRIEELLNSGLIGKQSRLTASPNSKSLTYLPNEKFIIESLIDYDMIMKQKYKMDEKIVPEVDNLYQLNILCKRIIDDYNRKYKLELNKFAFNFKEEELEKLQDMLNEIREYYENNYRVNKGRIKIDEMMSRELIPYMKMNIILDKYISFFNLFDKLLYKFMSVNLYTFIDNILNELDKSLTKEDTQNDVLNQILANIIGKSNLGNVLANLLNTSNRELMIIMIQKICEFNNGLLDENNMLDNEKCNHLINEMLIRDINISSQLRTKLYSSLYILFIYIFMNSQIDFINKCLDKYKNNINIVYLFFNEILQLYYRTRLDREEISTILNYKSNYEYIILKYGNGFTQDFKTTKSYNIYLAIQPNSNPNKVNFYVFIMNNKNNKIYKLGQILHYKDKDYYLSVDIDIESHYQIDMNDLLQHQTLSFLELQNSNVSIEDKMYENIKFIISNRQSIN